MKKSPFQVMNLDEWELLPHDGFLDCYEDGERKNRASNRRSSIPKTVFDMNYFMCPNPKSVIDTNYFMCPSLPSRKSMVAPNQVVPVTIQLEPITTPATSGKKEQEDGMAREVIKVPIDMTVVPSVISPKVKGPDYEGSRDEESDQDSVSQVFFKKMKENEFVDMKLDSPRSTGKGFAPPQIDACSFNFEDKNEVLEAKITSPRIKNTEKESAEDEEVIWEENNGGLNLLKWSMSGIGAICSFSVAAATFCIIIFGTHQKNMKHLEKQKLRFQIYTDDETRTS